MTESFLNKAKSALFFIVMLLLWFPLLQSTFVFFNEEPLGGAINNVEKPLYSYNSFLAGEYQNQLEEYQKSSFGFRNTMIRLNNQKMFSLYNIAKANGVIVGKEGYLYEENYIKSYIGEDYVGSQKVEENLKRFIKLREFLKSQNKDIIFIITPGKASFFPEYIPDKYFKKEKKKTNYEAYSAAFEKHKINYIDFRKWFVENKETSDYPLFPKCGIHWSKYSQTFVVDSIVRYIEKLRKIDLPNIIIDSIEVSKENRHEDYDIGEGMNLLFEMKTYPMAYPAIHFDTTSNKNKIKTLFVGDSFYWGLSYLGMTENICSNDDFWYYNEKVYSKDYNEVMLIDEIDQLKKIESVDLIILLFSEVNLVNFDYGFTEKTYNNIFNNTKETKSRVKYFIDQINASKEWLELMKEKAKQQNRPLKDLIIENAEYMVREEQAKAN